ncbi:hypothetical protein HEK616_39830 [Streptomyces nigrescens]|uniref:Uncharacterized protein n=1 Tax=Streptomyces nigrescens TaxID=1920 RepID=A0ABM7ZVV6_STRNI|nr:hypothetical protein HEK616_39830 [Streptomyces nigrescens]
MPRATPEPTKGQIPPFGSIVAHVTYGIFNSEFGWRVREDPFDDKTPPQRRGGPAGRLIPPPCRMSGRCVWIGGSGGPEQYGVRGPRGPTDSLG